MPDFEFNQHRFDISNLLSIGIVCIGTPVEVSMSRQDNNFRMPNGMKYIIKMMSTISSVNFPKRGIKEEQVFQYPSVLDRVGKLWRKEAFAAKDFDWI